MDATIIVPCSIGTMGSLAAGTSENLIHRAGAVALKEGWPLVLVPRETPLSLIAIRTMAALKEAGAVILPATPSFYGKPQTIEELVDTIVNRILDHIGLPDSRGFRWGQQRS